VLLGVGLAVAQPPKSKAMPEGWFGDLIGRSKPKAKDDAPPASTGPAQPSPQDRVLAHERIMNALLRRQAVCMRLREIADETNDKALDRTANELEEMADKLYKEQARALGISFRTTLPAEPEAEPEPEADGEPPSMPNLPRTGPLPARFRSGGMSTGIREGDR
jgi:hypothetical protein